MGSSTVRDLVSIAIYTIANTVRNTKENCGRKVVLPRGRGTVLIFLRGPYPFSSSKERGHLRNNVERKHKHTHVHLKT